MSIGRGFQGEIWYAPLLDYDSSTCSETYKLISDAVLDVRIDTGDRFNPIGDISAPSITAWLSQPSDPALHVEWVLQPNNVSSLATYCVSYSTFYSSTGTFSLRPLRFVVGANTEGITGAQSWWVLDGCIAKNLKMNGSRGKEIICSADFSVRSVTTSTTATGSEPTAIGKPYALFNNAGIGFNIYYGSSSQGGAKTIFVTDSFELNVENNVVDYWDCDSATKVASLPCKREFTGSCDISLENGGAVHWGEVFDGTGLWNLVFTTTTHAIAGVTCWDDRWTLNDLRFINTSVDINTSDCGMMVSQSFTAKHLVVD